MSHSKSFIALVKALLQIFHPYYILEREQADKFAKEHKILKEQHEKFLSITPYSDNHIEEPYKKMVQFIQVSVF